jgi:hypothetical protein
LWRRADWYEFTDVSEVCIASIIKAMSEAARWKLEEIKGSKFDRAALGSLHGPATQKTAFCLCSHRRENLKSCKMFLRNADIYRQVYTA